MSVFTLLHYYCTVQYLQIKMYDIYEGEHHLHLVLELVTGGELFDR